MNLTNLYLKPILSLLFFIILSLFHSTVANGQSTIYADIGLTMSRMSPSSSNNPYIKLRYSPSIGFCRRKVIKRNLLYSHVGVYFDRQGERMKEPAYSYYRETDLFIDYLKIPGKFEVKFYNFQFFAGVFLARAIRGKFIVTYIDSQRNREYEDVFKFQPLSNDYRSNNMYYIKKWNAGYNLAVGYKLDKISLMLNYEKGIRFVDEENYYGQYSLARRYAHWFQPDDGSLKTRSISLNLVYYFGHNHYK